VERADGSASRGSPGDRADFDAEYVATLTRHLDTPGVHGLDAANELGRRALEAGLSMLDLVGTHLLARSALLRARGIGQLDDMDAFLRESLDAFELTHRAYVESQRSATEARNRVAVLRGLSDAYLAIATASSIEERLHQVCVQAQQFLDAADARLEFGRAEPPPDDRPTGDEMVAELLGSGGRLILRAHPGRTWNDEDRAVLQQLAVLISAPIDDARRLDFTQRLERVGAVMAGAPDRDTIVDRLLQHGVAGIDAQNAALWLHDGEAPTVVTVPVAHMEPTREQQELLATVAETRDSVFLGNTEAIAAHLGRVHHTTDAAWAAVPMLAGDRCLGAIGLWYEDRQPFDVVQRSFIVQLANRVAAGLERGEAYERERLARRDAELASLRFQALHELATELSRASTRRRVAQVLLRRAIRWSEAVGGVVATTARGQPLEILAGSGELNASAPSSDGVVDTLLTELHSHGPEPDVAALPADLRSRLADHGVRSLAVYPIIAGRRFIGILALGWRDEFAADVLDEILRTQVAMAGPALARAERYDIEHDIAETLQRSVLAVPDVEVPGARWAVFYRAGSAGLAGGDWYDVYALDDRRLAITIGDVVGRGVQAAAAMGQLRSATRAMAQLVEDPAGLLSAVDELTANTGQGRYASMAFLVLDTATGDLEYSVAGHPPPVIRLPNGSTEALDTGSAPLLGIECKRETLRRHVPPGTLLVAYTDGLVERRTEGLDAGIGRLLSAVGHGTRRGNLDAFCSRLVTTLLQPAEDDVDDVAIVTVQLNE
jgi:GAF domain-containing protein